MSMVETAPSKIQVRNLNFYYGKFHALKNINLDIAKNQVTAFIGPSGCGKSTLLRTFNKMFELYPEQHCIKAPELLREGGVSEDIIHGVVSHGYGITVDVAPEHEMEKVLFAADELTGLIWAAALMRPSKSTKDMELKSLKKKYKSKGFAAGCSREVIERGAKQLGWELEKLLTMTLAAMAASEDYINEEMEKENV